MKRDNARLLKLCNRYTNTWSKTAKKAVVRLDELLDKGFTINKAVDAVMDEYSGLFGLDGLRDVLLEAACEGYGIMPSMLDETETATWNKSLGESWDAAGMTLSEKLHGTRKQMRVEIMNTLRTQMTLNNSWAKAAQALYDGYSKGRNAWTGGKDIIKPQEIAQYMTKVMTATTNRKIIVAQRTAVNQINQLARNGAPNKALQAAYQQLLDAALSDTEAALHKAVEVAINEKSRYVAERITRTEMARAYADGFAAAATQDDDIVAVRYRLGSRHPVFDICDMYAKADMFGLGAGIYPKDKVPPVPVHPYCMCQYSEVLVGEVNPKKEYDRIQKAGDGWLRKLTDDQKQAVLGVEGFKKWKLGGDWREYARGYAGFSDLKSRIKS